MTITLTDTFKESKMSGFDAYFVSDDVSFSVKTENASDLEYQGYEIAGLKDYAKEICSLNGIPLISWYSGTTTIIQQHADRIRCQIHLSALHAEGREQLLDL